jgi:hypothetical protein
LALGILQVFTTTNEISILSERKKEECDGMDKEDFFGVERSLKVRAEQSKSYIQEVGKSHSESRKKLSNTDF